MKNVLPCGPVLICALAALSGCSSMTTVPYTVDAYLKSTPDTVVLGHLPAGRKPVLTVKSGQVVRIDTIRTRG